MRFVSPIRAAVWSRVLEGADSNMRQWHVFAQRWAEYMESALGQNEPLHEAVVVQTWNSLTGRRVTALGSNDQDMFFGVSFLYLSGWMYGERLMELMRASMPSIREILATPRYPRN